MVAKNPELVKQDMSGERVILRLDEDLERLFVGKGLLADLKKRIAKTKDKLGGRANRLIEVTPVPENVASRICDEVGKQIKLQEQLKDLLCDPELPDILKEEVSRLAEKVLKCSIKEPELWALEPGQDVAKALWEWIGKGNRHVLSDADWQKVLSVLYLRRLKGTLGVRQANEFLWRALFMEPKIALAKVLNELNKGGVVPLDELFCSRVVSMIDCDSGHLLERLVLILQQCGAGKPFLNPRDLVVAVLRIKRHAGPSKESVHNSTDMINNNRLSGTTLLKN